LLSPHPEATLVAWPVGERLVPGESISPPSPPPVRASAGHTLIKPAHVAGFVMSGLENSA
jgi:hypothetical protein